MKNLFKIMVAALILAFSLPFLMVSADSNPSGKKELRGVWVATVVNIDYPAKPTTDAEILKSEAVAILDHAKNTGLNAVFLQVRPASDALYKSQYFPWSKYLTGTQGLAPSDDFDPLAFWIEEAHNRGIELHAWINPYRITKKASKEPIHDFASLVPSHPARTNPTWVVKHTDGSLYFNPGIPEVRKLIVDSVLEVIQNYAVDGIHFDDYFYPGKSFNDKATYEQYGSAFRNIEDWRRENVNSLVSEVSKAIKADAPHVRFGISPFGIWANKSVITLGSDTKGSQSYFDHYADTRKWVKEGLIDYIMPQLYWNIGLSVADYSKLLSWWKSTVADTGVDLYIGQAAYRTGHTDPSSPWYGISEIEKQLKLNGRTPGVMGSVFFSYKSLADNPALSAMIKAIYEQRDGSAAPIRVTVSRPLENIRTSLGNFYLSGSSDPSKPLFLNGKPVENRSKQGFYGVLVPLAEGENIFTFSQEGSYASRVIFRNTASSTPAKMKTVEIPASSAFPQAQEYRMPGEKVTLSCQAPVGSKVTVKLGGKSYQMKPSTTAVNGSGVYPATFTCVYTIPTYTGTARNINLGAPVYSMSYKGVRKTRTAPAKVGVIMKNSPFYAKVTKGVIDTYQSPSSGNGAAYELYNGMVDYVTGMTGSYVRLSSGQWVFKSGVQIYTTKLQLKPIIKKAEYKTGMKWDTVRFDISSPVAAITSFDGNSLKLNISAALTAPLPVLPGDSLFSSAAVTRNGRKVQYTLTLKKNQRLEGYYIEKTTTGMTLNIKRRVIAKDGDQPLSGLTIMVDPGHGGNETGAIGPLGLKYAEKTINLKSGLQLKAELERLGAKVLMTRTTDKTVSLGERLTASRNAKPDLFLSMHANAMEDNVDMTKYDGFSVFYREELAKPLSEAIYQDVLNDIDRREHGVHDRNFYVTRGTWTPSILLESGFVTHPDEFEWLMDENEQARLVKSISESIVRYFKN
jgi:uncharacterized lipoprotein YddW (UPF0748 family)/N-acetylmuramoyl-L-alanine amidase